MTERSDIAKSRSLIFEEGCGGMETFDKKIVARPVNSRLSHETRCSSSASSLRVRLLLADRHSSRR